MQEYKYNNKLIIGIDHGYGNIKTAHKVFTTGAETYEGEPVVSTNYVKYEGMYYVIGESHLTYQGDKTISPEFYVLTLAGLAEELKMRGKNTADIIIAAGLPLAWAKSQQAEFKKYLIQNEYVTFEYKKEKYKIHICGADIFPQGFAAIYDQGRMDGTNMIVDIGNGTMNVMQIQNGRPIEKSVYTEKFGVSICMKEIQNELAKDYAESIDESLIDPLLRTGCRDDNNPLSGRIKKVASRYAGEILKRLSSYGYKEGLVKLYVIGGGGCLLKYYTDISGKAGVVFIDDIRANAKGYEYLAYQKIKLLERR